MIGALIIELASRQYGLFSRLQVLALGGTDDLIKQRLAAGRWVAVAPGVYSLPGWRDSWRRSLWLAHLDVGPASVVSHEAAAALHGLALFQPGPVVVTVAHGDHERPGPWTARQSRDLRPRDVTRLDGLAVTTIPRTLFDLAAVASKPRLERTIDDAHVARRCRYEELQEVYDQLRGKGKPGMARLGRILDFRGPGYVPPESVLERRLLKVLRDGGLPEPRLQMALPWRPDAPQRVDMGYPDDHVLIEGDGRRWHSRMDQVEHDRRRDRDALNHGWRPYRFGWEEITRSPALVQDTVRTALRLAA